MTEVILTNARLVLSEMIVHGTIVVRGATIHDIAEGPSTTPGAQDCDGDFVIPGIVDVHTDNLERQVQPRSNARWPSRSALVAHDQQCAATGVTTVLDALCLGDLGFDKDRLRTFREGVADLDALADTGLLKSEHFLHLRCEMPAIDVLDLVEPVADHRLVRMVSLMDHSPGYGQYANIDVYRALRRKDGHSDAHIDQRIAELTEQRARTRAPNRAGLLAMFAGRDIPIASHDDETAEEVNQNHADGIRISEFPVTALAARIATEHSMGVIAGAPNIVRGGSHTGNVAAADLVRAGTAQAFASDYVPAALVEAAFACVQKELTTLPQAIGMVSAAPAQMAGLTDRGRLAPGLRADLARVRLHGDLPVVRQVWRAGERVA